MNIIIHRGTHQIGGCVTEIKTESTRIFIDFGAELTPCDTTSSDIHIKGLTDGKTDCDAVLFTHYHGDHVGMMDNILPGIPLYIGETSKQILTELYKRQKKDVGRIENMQTFQAAKSFYIGNIKITPFTVDHSAYDAYMFLIEANGKRVLHTGDFRVHGFRGKGLLPTLRKYVGQVDLLIIEGTSLSRGNEKVMSEYQLTKSAKQIFDENKYVFVLCSSTNIDRLAAFHSVVPYGRYTVCDEYQKRILNIAEMCGKSKSRLYNFSNVLTYGENFLEKMQSKGCCMFVRATPYFKKIIDRFDKEKSVVIYSMWKGYLDDDSTGLKSFLSGSNTKYLHTSGHAAKNDIVQVINEVKPKIGVVPIHTENPLGLTNCSINSNLIFLKDNEMLTI